MFLIMLGNEIFDPKAIIRIVPIVGKSAINPGN